MQVLITITAGASTGPFKIYGNLNNFATPIISGLTRAQLVAGYTATVPDGTTIVRVMSYGVCFKEIDITITGPVITTTTTSSTSSTTTLPVPSIALGQAICRYNNCNDNAGCAVVYDITVNNAPPGSYVDMTILPPSSTATVSLTDVDPITATLLYSEPSGSALPVYFKLELKIGANTVLASSDTSLTHQSFWPFLPSCGV